MNLPFAMGLFGLIVCLVFAFNAARELRRNQPGHSRNAAMIHVAMVSMGLPFCLYVLVAHAP